VKLNRIFGGTCHLGFQVRKIQTRKQHTDKDQKVLCSMLVSCFVKSSTLKMKAICSSETSVYFHSLLHCVISQMRGIFSRKVDFRETGCEVVELIPRLENCTDSAQRDLVVGGGTTSNSVNSWLYQQYSLTYFHETCSRRAYLFVYFLFFGTLKSTPRVGIFVM
jgi:hypothetical protein